MICFGDAYRGRRVLLTGHSGFKGSWLALWLTQLGAQVSGVALPAATIPNHWELLGLDMDAYNVDLRDAAATASLVQRLRPDIVFHLAAQSLVRRSYRQPLDTWSTNVMGTANLLEACVTTHSVRAIVVVTSDKCYQNDEARKAFRETDPLGGHDPYSSSKAATELVAASYRHSFLRGSDAPQLATARAGNVIGGGDWSEDRLVPDLVRSVASGQALQIRSPTAVRPWQHVLDPLAAYLLLGQGLLQRKEGMAQAWNFGPTEQGTASVEEVLGRLQHYWPQVAWNTLPQQSMPEASFLALDSTQANVQLGWKPVWSLDATLNFTAEWYRDYLGKRQVSSREQLARYIADAVDGGHRWSWS